MTDHSAEMTTDGQDPVLDVSCYACGTRLGVASSSEALRKDWQVCTACGSNVVAFTYQADRERMAEMRRLDVYDWDPSVNEWEPIDDEAQSDGGAERDPDVYPLPDDPRSSPDDDNERLASWRAAVDDTVLSFGLTFPQGSVPTGEVADTIEPVGWTRNRDGRMDAVIAASTVHAEEAIRRVIAEAAPGLPIKIHADREPGGSGPGIPLDSVEFLIGGSIAAILALGGAYPGLKELGRDLRSVIRRIRGFAYHDVEASDGIAWLQAREVLAGALAKDLRVVAVAPMRRGEFDDLFGWQVTFHAGDEWVIVVLDATGEFQGLTRMPALEMGASLGQEHRANTETAAQQHDKPEVRGGA